MKETRSVIDGEAATHEIYCCDLCFGIPWRDVNDQTGYFAINDSLQCFKDDSVMCANYHLCASALFIEVAAKILAAFYTFYSPSFYSLFIS